MRRGRRNTYRCTFDLSPDLSTLFLEEMSQGVDLHLNSFPTDNEVTEAGQEHLTLPRHRAELVVRLMIVLGYFLKRSPWAANLSMPDPF